MIAHHPPTLADDAAANLDNLTIFLPSRATNGEASRGTDPFARTREATSQPAADPKPQLAGFTIAELERLAITQTLQMVGGNRTKAARKLGISVRTLQRKLRMWQGANPIGNGDIF